jgi:hypothetical protein
MTISVTELMSDADFGAAAVTRLRPTRSLGNQGESSVAYASSSLTAIAQPAKTTDANLLPEGVRVSDVEAFFTAGDLSVGDGNTLLPDLIQHAGITYRVLNVQDFSQHGYRRALAQRLAIGTPGAS